MGSVSLSLAPDWLVTAVVGSHGHFLLILLLQIQVADDPFQDFLFHSLDLVVQQDSAS